MSGRILWETVIGETGLRATQTDANHVTLELVIDGTNNVLRLPATQVVALGAVLLHANLGHFAEFAEHMTDEAAAALGLVLLAPSARRSVERETAASWPEAAN
jgi:hypothetical protein